ncbi:hypothetical protein [Parafannyhessea umbonata]|uniref:hypothetical protein n=1 Tax=Parafannyhessea umbonata TaxID=604330 RepID=UPI001FE0E300|nr:hypothetical protein [Parafannyhessea umbonata]
MAQSSSVARHDSHSTTEQGSGWSTKRIAVTALFCALAAICTLFVEFPILPAVPGSSTTRPPSSASSRASRLARPRAPS